MVLPFGCSLMPLNIHPAAAVAPLDDASGAAASSSNDAADLENALTPTANGDCITTPPARAKAIRGFISAADSGLAQLSTGIRQHTCTAGFSRPPIMKASNRHGFYDRLPSLFSLSFD